MEMKGNSVPKGEIMVFSSMVFLCVFLPAVLILYYIIPGITAGNILLLCASLLFYAYGEPVYILLMVGSAFANYLFAIAIDRAGTVHGRRF